MVSPAVPLTSADEAATVVDAKERGCARLSLAGTFLTSIPQELRTLKALTNLDLSDNSLMTLDNGCLPLRLKELVLTGCSFTSVPSCLRCLTNLEKLFIGANRLEDVETVFQCTSLNHAGLSYNSVSTLPVQFFSGMVNLLSLDLAHNNLGISAIEQLQQLPSLASLSLSGNPMCLVPSYQLKVRSSFKKLLFLDGQKLDQLAGSRPATGATPPALLGAGGAAGTERLSALGADTFLELDFSGLQPLDDPFADLKQSWEDEAAAAAEAAAEAAAAAAAAGGKPGKGAAPPAPVSTGPPKPPPQPVYYHIEVSDADGTEYCSVPLCVPPPKQSEPEEDPKAKAKAAAAAKPKTPPKGKPKGGKGAEEEAPPPVLRRGALKVVLGVAADVAWRDWLRAGIKLKVLRTRVEAVPKVLTPEEEAAAAAAAAETAAAAAKGKKPPKAAVEDPNVVDMSKFDIVVHPPECLAQGTLACGALVSGSVYKFVEQCQLTPPPALWDSAGIRMALEDPRHPKEPSAKLACRVLLHVLPESMTA